MGDVEVVKNEAMEIMGLFQLLPRLVVFDLDYTLWPFYCECRSKRETPRLYPHAKGILYALKEKGVGVAIASRSPTPDIANSFLDKLGIKSMFVAQEIFSSWTHKTDHFQRIQRKTQIPYNEMLFFDDEDRNIETVSKMGVTSILVGNGVNLGAFRQGLSEFSQNRSSLGKSKPGRKNEPKKSSSSETEES
ncbi:Haloacid dehalogenase-like hydrolase (HAD) superfamily protein [Striga hermonthica]|uniref:Haloacid dehalogenase-like hydrolase (HAD) superfamily protein n=1 Tax=Striga hermonthica TaxID=68872 RepID=A0A9N7MIE9_STRHE|nr:Haloacid dehalogenase-like hydrolase (HAD) superfamily protein [Striga hermonthica]